MNKVIVFLGAATQDQMRIQRPNREADFQKLVDIYDRIDFVDPEYLNKNANDTVLFIASKKYPSIHIYPVLSNEYFAKILDYKSASLITILDFTGSYTRYDLIGSRGFHYDISNVHYLAPGCFGEYKFEPGIWQVPNPPLVEKPTATIRRGGTKIKHLSRSDTMNIYEAKEYKNDTKMLISYIIARYHITPTPNWVLNQDKDFIAGFDKLGVDKVIDMLIAVYYNHNLKPKDPISILETIRRELII